MENTGVILSAMLRGFTDSIKGTFVIFSLDKNIRERAQRAAQLREKAGSGRRKEISPDAANVAPKRQEEAKVLTRTLQCCVLNGGVFWLSIFFFESGLLPALKYLLTALSPSAGLAVWSWTSLFLSWTFGTIWVLPLLLLSKIVNSLWFQDIADTAYRFRSGRPQLSASISKVIADNLFSILVQTLFLAQSVAVSMLPLGFLSELLCQLHMCMLYSLYSFEYKWYNMGWELQKRLTYIEDNWPYFVGFGIPLAVLTALPHSYIVSGCVFSILFPLFILSGHEASPVTGSCNFSLPLFTPVIVICNTIFNQAIGAKPAHPDPVHR